MYFSLQNKKGWNIIWLHEWTISVMVLPNLGRYQIKQRLKDMVQNSQERNFEYSEKRGLAHIVFFLLCTYIINFILSIKL